MKTEKAVPYTHTHLLTHSLAHKVQKAGLMKSLLN